MSFVAFSAFGHGERDAVGIHAVRFAVAVKSEWRHDGNNALAEQGLEKFGIHALHLAGEQMIHALDDAHRMRDDGVGRHGAEVVGGKTFENFVRQPVRGGQRELERVRVRDAPAPSRSDALVFCSSARNLICAEAP